LAILLRHEVIEGLLAVDEVITAVREGLREQGDGLVQVPPRITIDASSGQGWLRVMPAILNRSGVMGYKAMNSTPKVGVRYLVMLYDLPSGQLLAQMDADWITQQRTAAIAAVATDELANQDVQQVGLLGSGAQAQALLTAIAAVRRVPRVRVFSPTPEHRRRFAEHMCQQLGLDVVAVDAPEEAMVGGDLLLSAIRSGREPVFKGEWVSGGAHVAAISSVRPDSRELDDDVWRRADVVVVDEKSHAFESGDGRSALASGAAHPDRAIELFELVSGHRLGRERSDQITLFKSVGTAAQDLSIARAIYERALQRGLGQEIGEFPRVRGS
jgi:ornithine cyclodeaminase/alanine dehydrogenase-like protein (mu-crystallin family)